jgi:inhibitor of cysteine peptidase
VTRSPPPLEFDESANGREVPVALGQTIALSLSENPTTGFRWELAEDGQPACAPLGESFTENTTGGVGRGGTRRWLFKAVAAGSSRIALVSRRAWEKREPERTVRFSVLVSP